jgi:hypothetical protein
MHFSLAHSEHLARNDLTFLHRLPVEECSVGGTEILDRNCAVVDANLAVGTGNGRMVYLQIGVNGTAHFVDAGRKLDLPDWRSRDFDDNSVHEPSGFA